MGSPITSPDPAPLPVQALTTFALILQALCMFYFGLLELPTNNSNWPAAHRRGKRPWPGRVNTSIGLIWERFHMQYYDRA
ncbi:hypothetical protein PspLS_07974 [Pyricularia sp. CBS 133598]|nr:hypothetical protein PspLS_07974 [Pyricularia sp. CBS 133598]